ncbi:hypothetical protein LINGRAHAP2_LOCUS12855 [Linum grandiflorum]
MKAVWGSRILLAGTPLMLFAICGICIYVVVLFG